MTTITNANSPLQRFTSRTPPAIHGNSWLVRYPPQVPPIFLATHRQFTQRWWLTSRARSMTLASRHGLCCSAYWQRTRRVRGMRESVQAVGSRAAHVYQALKGCTGVWALAGPHGTTHRGGGRGEPSATLRNHGYLDAQHGQRRTSSDQLRLHAARATPVAVMQGPDDGGGTDPKTVLVGQSRMGDATSQCGRAPAALVMHIKERLRPCMRAIATSRTPPAIGRRRTIAIVVNPYTTGHTRA